MAEIRYGFAKTVEGSFEEVKKKVTEALASEGFGVLTEIDAKATLKKKLDAEFRPYVILGACNPPLAHQALQAERHIGLLLPCNVVVQQAEEQGKVDVSVLSPKALFELVGREEIAPLAEQVEQKLRRVLDSI
ncbi:MAG: DUF302 domain-containing protein [Deltaproteobacteria bacterium]|nr:MAG: DUF302 domain-containing protein [Deltaproteobacteria bacterium]